MATLPKSMDPDWPSDLCCPGAIPRFGPEQLPVLEVGYPDWGMKMAEMFDYQEIATQMQQGDLELGDPFRDLRETIKVFFVCAVKDSMFIHEIKGKEEHRQSDASSALYIKVHLPFRRLPDQRPLAVLTVVDHAEARRLLDAGKISLEQELDNFRSSILQGCEGSCNAILCSKAELQLLRSLLQYNARRMVPTTWQQQKLPKGRYTTWMATWISTIYPEVLGDSSRLVKEAEKCLEQQTAAAGSRSCRSNREPVAAARMAGTARAGNGATAAAAGTGEAGQAACVVCGAREAAVAAAGASSKPLLRCSRCKSDHDRYCSVACQRADWRRHKPMCRSAAG